jgi:hypothetical protein
MRFSRNVTSAYVDLSSLTDEDVRTDILTENNGLLLLNSKCPLNIANVHEDSIASERPTFAIDPSCVVKDGRVVYTFQLGGKNDLDTIHSFYLYFQSGAKVCMNDFDSLKVYHKSEDKDLFLCETISREFFAVWFRTFKQGLDNDDVVYLPIFLNRHNLSYYSCVKHFFLTLEVSFAISDPVSQEDYSQSVYLSYRTKAIRYTQRENIVKQFDNNNMYYIYDAIFDMVGKKKWISMDSYYRFETDIRLSKPFHRLSDLFVVLCRKSGAVEERDKEIVQKLSVFYEETLVFDLPAKMAESLLSPVKPHVRGSKQNTFAPEIISIYYLPFSTTQSLFESYVTRPYVNTSKIGFIALQIETDRTKVYNKDLYEICICYMSPNNLCYKQVLILSFRNYVTNKRLNRLTNK